MPVINKEESAIPTNGENNGANLTCKPEENKKKDDSKGSKDKTSTDVADIKVADNANLTFELEEKPKNGSKEKILPDSARDIIIASNVTYKHEENQKYGVKNGKVEALKDAADTIVKDINTVSAEGNSLFGNANSLIASCKRFGLVGPKYCEKTLLHKQLAAIADTSDVLYWNPEIKDDTVSVTNYVMGTSKKYFETLAEYEALKAGMDKNDDPKLKDKLLKLKKDLIMLDPNGSTARVTVEIVLIGLGFPYEIHSEKVRDIPEHLKKKISLAQALVLMPKLLILVEPTSVLDINAVIWLENYLKTWPTTLIIVSQDYSFLEMICDEIIYFDQQFQFQGNESSFEESVRNGKLNVGETSTQNGETLKVRSKNETENDNKEQSGESEKQLQKLDLLFCNPVNSKQRELLQLKDVTYNYKRKNHIINIFDKLNFQFHNKQAVAVLGPSGVGKSTFFRVAKGELIPEKGEVERHVTKINIGIFNKVSIKELNIDQTPLKYLIKRCGLLNKKAIKAQEQLSKMGLPSSSHSCRLKDLSANEKALVILAKFCLFPYDALLLDDPTRYLDFEMINKLKKAMLEYKGGMMIITNNESLIREANCQLYCIENKDLHKVADFITYRKTVLEDLVVPDRSLLQEDERKIILDEFWPAEYQSDSKIIEKYIEDHTDIDESIKEIGKYYIIYEQSTEKNWFAVCPTLSAHSAWGPTKKECQKQMFHLLEHIIEDMILDGKTVPPPP